MKFQEESIDLGTIKPLVKKIFVFTYSKEANERILELKQSCGCGEVKNDPKLGHVKVEYMPAEVPIQVTSKGKTAYKTRKTITVKYDSGEGTEKKEIVLEFLAIVKI